MKRCFLGLMLCSLGASVIAASDLSSGPAKNFYAVRQHQFVDLQLVEDPQFQIMQDSKNNFYLADEQSGVAAYVARKDVFAHLRKPQTQWVDAGPIYSTSGAYKSSKVICPGVCNKYGDWNGQWRTITTKVGRVTSVCQCYSHSGFVYGVVHTPPPYKSRLPRDPGLIVESTYGGNPGR